MCTADHQLDRRHLGARDYGLTLDPQEMDRMINRERAINAVEAKLARLLDELGKEMEFEQAACYSDADLQITYY